MSKPFFSIIIPTYNRADHINKTIQSILNQLYTSFELIIVDDGSTDNTKEVIKALEDKRISYFYKENAERGAARNFGVLKAQGEYITFLDSDDVLYENHLSEAAIFIKEKLPEIMFQGYEIVSETKKVVQSFPKAYINKLLLTEGNVMSCHGIFIKNEIIKQNLFNEDYQLSGLEDYELWLRISSQYKIDHNPIVTSCLVNHASRSVLEINKDKLIRKNELFLKYVTSNKQIEYYISPYKNFILSNTYTYIALHLVLSGYKILGFKYFRKGLKFKPTKLFSLRSMAIIKHLIN